MGEVLVHTTAGKASALDKIKSVLAGANTYSIERSRFTPKGWLIKFQEITSIEQAESLRGTELFTSRTNLSPTAENEYYLCDLMKCTGIDSDSKNSIGKFKNLETGPNISWWVFENNSTTLLVPAVSHFIKSVDLKNHLIYLQNLSKL